MQRVLVLIARHAAHRRMRRRATPRFRGHLDLGRDPVDQQAAVLSGQIGLVRRRHLPVAQHGENVDPPIDVIAADEVGVELVDAQPAALLVRSVARDARRFENGIDLRAKRVEIGRGGSAGRGREPRSEVTRRPCATLLDRVEVGANGTRGRTRGLRRLLGRDHGIGRSCDGEDPHAGPDDSCAHCQLHDGR